MKGMMTSVKKRISSIENSSELDIYNEEITVIYKQFKTYQNIINKLTKISKGNHQKYFHEHENNMLKTWDRIKSIININKKEKKDINCLKVDDQQATDPFVISNYFNKFFTTIAKKIESKIVQTDKKYSDFLDSPLEKTFFLTPTEPNEVQSLIKTISLSKFVKKGKFVPKVFFMFQIMLRMNIYEVQKIFEE